MGWVVMCYADFDELYLDEIIPMPKWLEHPFYRDCLTLSVVYQSPWPCDSALSCKRIADGHTGALLAQLLVEQLSFCLAKRNF